MALAPEFSTFHFKTEVLRRWQRVYFLPAAWSMEHHALYFSPISAGSTAAGEPTVALTLVEPTFELEDFLELLQNELKVFCIAFLIL